MTLKNPYKILGLNENADEKAIKQAFKKLAKYHHPDIVGEETEKFREIKAAYDLLMNEQHRKMYDQYGVVYGSSESHMTMMAMGECVRLFQTIIMRANPEDLEYCDIFGEMRTTIKNSIKEHQKQIAQLVIEQGRLEQILITLQRNMKNAKGENVFIKSLQNTINGIPGVKANKTNAIAVSEQMLAFLEGYSFDFKKQAVISSYGTSGGSTGSVEAFFGKLNNFRGWPQ